MDIRNAGPERYDEPEHDGIGLLRMILRIVACIACVGLFGALLLIL